jgi:hypothetical protein
MVAGTKIHVGHAHRGKIRRRRRRVRRIRLRPRNVAQRRHRAYAGWGITRALSSRLPDGNGQGRAEQEPGSVLDALKQ